MRFLISSFILLCLCSCEYNAATIKEQTPPLYRAVAKGNWESAGECALDQLEKTGQPNTAIRKLNQKKESQVMVTWGNSFYWMMDFKQTGKNIEKTLWEAPTLILGGPTKDELIAIINHCN